jgi:hypothetical protein
MNWYKRIKISQIWVTDRDDDSFEDALTDFYELEYQYHSLKNYPFKGLPQRYQYILRKVEESLYDLMGNLKGTLISTFKGWLDSHAITNPRAWAEQRSDPNGEGFMSSYDAEDTLSGIIGEYQRYLNGGSNMNFYNRPKPSNTFDQMLEQAIDSPEKFESLNGLRELLMQDEKERLYGDLSYEGPENFGVNHRGEPFATEEEAEAFIDEQVEGTEVGSYFYGEQQQLLSILEGQGEMENFMIELNQHLVFPLWYDYWRAQGIDTTRELAEEAYEGLVNANGFDEFHEALEIAIQTCHQNGSMLEYLDQYGGQEMGSDPETIEGIMLELSQGKPNSEWDGQLIGIGVQIPDSVIRNNLETANA